jgi:DNA-binding transcriptional LysR family regulator
MELRHLRYFVAVAEAQSFAHGAERLNLAQPALSKQIRDLEAEVGTPLFQRLPRGVRLTPAGEAFLSGARQTLSEAAGAVASARGAAGQAARALEFAHGEVASYTVEIERLLAAFSAAHGDVTVRVTSQGDGETYTALQQQRIDVGCVFTAEWPLRGFRGLRLIDTRVTGVLLPGAHRLAAAAAVRLGDLHDLTWLHSSGSQRWPGFMATMERALRERGLVPRRMQPRARQLPSVNMQIAAGNAWSLVTETVAGPYLRSGSVGSTAIVYRPIAEPPIPCWLALVWRPHPSVAVRRLAEIARRVGLVIEEDHVEARIA